MTTREQPSFLDRVGGPQAVARLVDAFYDRVASDPVLRPLYPEDLRPGREKLKLFFVQWLGGPPLYSERFGHPRLRRRHFPFVIDERAAERWLALMHEAMVSVGVPEGEREVIEARLRPLAFHIVNANDDVPREPLREGWMD